MFHVVGRCAIILCLFLNVVARTLIQASLHICALNCSMDILPYHRNIIPIMFIWSDIRFHHDIYKNMHMIL